MKKATIDVRAPLPKEVHGELKAMAARAGVTLTAYLIALIVREVGGPVKK